MNDRTLVYLMAISVLTGLLVAVASASHLTRIDIHSKSKDDSRGITVGRRGRRLSDLLVSAEMILAVVLFTSAVVISHSFLNVYSANTGVDISNVLTMALSFPPERYPGPEARISLYRALDASLQALPGVQSVGTGSAAPTDYLPLIVYERADAPIVEQQSRPSVASMVVSTGYFRTLGARVIAGREFDGSDRPSSMPVVIVNRQFAERSWPGEVPIGKRLRLYRVPRQDPTPWLTVVGVVSNIVQNDRTRQAFDPLIYLPRDQYGGAGFVFVRTNLAPASLATAVRRHVYALDSAIAISNLMPLTERLARAYSFERNITVLLLVFSMVSLLVASIGLYATVSHSVIRRVQEIGIRVAIGATGNDILKLIFKQGVLPVGAGLGTGLAISFALNRLLKSQLVGVSPADPIALVIASAVLVLSAGLGCWLPARRATKIDPVVALKHE